MNAFAEAKSTPKQRKRTWSDGAKKKKRPRGNRSPRQAGMTKDTIFGFTIGP